MRFLACVISVIENPLVIGSGSSRNEASASPRVTSGSGSLLHTMEAMQQTLTRLHDNTAIMMPKLNWVLHSSSTGKAKQYCMVV